MAILFRIIIIFLISPVFAGDLYNDERTNVIKNINETITRAKRRVKASPDIRAADLLKLLPSFSLGQKGPTTEIPSNEYLFSVTINTNQIFDIADRVRDKETLKRKALQKIREEGFILKKLAERKFLIKKQIWKFSQIRNSTDSPVEHATIDEKIDDLTVKLQETEIETEKRLTEVEFVCIEVEK
jgi:hypothetical protein